MLNLNYLLEIKIDTKNSAPDVGMEPETLAVSIQRCTVMLTRQPIYCCT